MVLNVHITMVIKKNNHVIMVIVFHVREIGANGVIVVNSVVEELKGVNIESLGKLDQEEQFAPIVLEIGKNSHVTMMNVFHVREIGMNGVIVVNSVVEELKGANIESLDKLVQEEKVAPIVLEIGKNSRVMNRHVEIVRVDG